MTTCGTQRVSDYPLRRVNLTHRSTDTNEILGVRIRYILIENPSVKVSRLQIEAQHRSMQKDFNATNEDNSHVPTIFRDLITKARIQFQWTGHIKRLHDSSATVFNSLKEVKTKYPIAHDNKLIVYMASCRPGFLGEAELFGNYCLINYRTVGGPAVVGDPTIPGYNRGRTLTHELGHVFGLQHIFDGDCVQDFPDIPAQKYPNPEAILVPIERKNGPLEWESRLDNAFRDCHGSTFDVPGLLGPYSCASSPAEACTRKEQSMNFMDYCSDPNALFFTKSQVELMRKFLIQTPTLTVYPKNHAEFVWEKATPRSNSDDFQTWWIVLVVLLVVVIIVIFVVAFFIPTR